MKLWEALLVALAVAFALVMAWWYYAAVSDCRAAGGTPVRGIGLRAVECIKQPPQSNPQPTNMTMTKEEFMTRYASRSGLAVEECFGPGAQVSLPCACGDSLCEGWAAVSDNPLSIKAHMDLYAPKPGLTSET